MIEKLQEEYKNNDRRLRDIALDLINCSVYCAELGPYDKFDHARRQKDHKALLKSYQERQDKIIQALEDISNESRY